MSFGLLLSIFDDCLKKTRIRSHNSWLEDYLSVEVFMRGNFGLLRLNFKSKLFNSIRILLSHIKLDRAGYLVRILNFDLFCDSIWNFWRNKGSEVENFLLHKKYIWFHHVCDVSCMLLAWQDQLLLEDRFKSFGIYAGDARFSNDLVKDSIWFVVGVSVFYINSNLLLEKLLAISSKFHFNCDTRIRTDCAWRGWDGPLPNF